MHDLQSGPASDVCTDAVARALASVRAKHRSNPDLAHMTGSAVAERVTALTLPPRPARGDWWLVGRVLDEIEEVEFSVWFIPATRRIGITRREQPTVIAPAAPLNMPCYYDGLRRNWIDSLTGEVVPGPDGENRESGLERPT
ncbi:MAG: hypothetical protein KC432_07885 [Thermomicrobiales bacterium]|nr:hypothetical protein [Thermomicrobiales bacterium]